MHGYQLLVDRRWPGSSRANVDCILVGPAGAFIVDPKCWAEVELKGGTVIKGGREVTTHLTGLEKLSNLTRAKLAEVGLPPTELHVLAVLAGRAEKPTLVGGIEVLGEQFLPTRILSTGRRLTPGQVDTVMQACRTLFPPFDEPVTGDEVDRSADPDGPGQIPRPRGTADPGPADPDAVEGAALSEAMFEQDEVEEALITAALSPPIEQWMTFLHPEQAKVVQRTMSGTARIRGAAGTGKSVVGLHRAAWLARTRQGTVLFTSFVRTLPLVTQQLYRGLSPETEDRVEFRSVHSLAASILSTAGVSLRVDPSAVEREFNRAWSMAGHPGPLGRSAQGKGYWSDEISKVIKGRGLTSFEQYADLRRVGRRYPVGPELRQAVWDLYECYQQQLEQLGVIDFDDQLILAERALADLPQPQYAHVIVDEVQDLTCVGARLVAGLVDDRPDALLLIGDGQQAIYPGGFTLAEAGIDVRGRSTVLRHNYRNTVEILRVAQEVVGDDAFSDLDDDDEIGQREVVVTRHGDEPVLCVVTSQRELDRALVRAVDQVRSLREVGDGDIAVLTAHNSDAHRYLRLLRELKIPAMNLADYTGIADDRVKVGTFHRAKGLEFKQVLLPGWNARQPQRDPGQTDAAHRDRLELERRQLFVAMTRARDGLWLGSVRTS